MRKVVILGLYLLISSLSGRAQSSGISSDEFFGSIRKANDTTDSVPYRSTSTSRSFNGQIPKQTERVQISESLPNGNRRLVQREGEKVIEVITVSNRNYQRDNGGKWRIVTTPENVVLFRSISGPHTSEYSTGEDSLDGQKVTVLTWFIKQGTEQFSENKWFVASNGRIVREESRGGTLGQHKSVTWDEVVVYDYNVGSLIIRAPIK